MKRALILCLFFLFLIFSETCGNCAITFFPPLQPIGGVNPIQNYSNITSTADPFADPSGMNYPDISRIESSLFGHSFDGQNISSRLSRIERTLFTTTYPNSSNAQRIDNIISNFNQINRYPNISRNVLSRIEAKVFNQSFPQNSAERRIERIEQRLFGAVQSGDIDSRYNSILAAAKNYNANPVNTYYPNSVATSGGWKGILNSFGNAMLGGTMTGFTPPIDPYGNNYGYNNSPYSGLGGGSGIYRGNRRNNGWGGYSYQDNYSGYGSGTGVTILN